LENVNRRDHLHNINTSYTKRVTEGYEMDSFGSGQGKIEGSCERGNKPLGSTNGRKCLH